MDDDRPRLADDPRSERGPSITEVDKARGRIGLKLVNKHEDGKLVSPEELIERAKSAPRRGPRRRSGRVATDAASEK